MKYDLNFLPENSPEEIVQCYFWKSSVQQTECEIFLILPLQNTWKYYLRFFKVCSNDIIPAFINIFVAHISAWPSQNYNIVHEWKSHEWTESAAAETS